MTSFRQSLFVQSPKVVNLLLFMLTQKQSLCTLILVESGFTAFIPSRISDHVFFLELYGILLYKLRSDGECRYHLSENNTSYRIVLLVFIKPYKLYIAVILVTGVNKCLMVMNTLMSIFEYLLVYNGVNASRKSILYTFEGSVLDLVGGRGSCYLWVRLLISFAKLAL